MQRYKSLKYGLVLNFVNFVNDKKILNCIKKIKKMNKIILPASTMLFPVPTVMVTCGADESEHNIITIAWTGTICSEPPMCYVSIRPSRYSHGIISKNKEFVINLTTAKIAEAMDWCGVRSGNKYNKFSETGLTKIPAKIVNAPMIKESPVNIECQVKNILKLGTHDMFIAEVVAVHANEDIVDIENKKIDLTKSELVCYSNTLYVQTDKIIGKHGFSLKNE